MRDENIRLRMELESARQELSELSQPMTYTTEPTSGLAEREFRVVVPSTKGTVKTERSR